MLQISTTFRILWLSRKTTNKSIDLSGIPSGKLCRSWLYGLNIWNNQTHDLKMTPKQQKSASLVISQLDSILKTCEKVKIPKKEKLKNDKSMMIRTLTNRRHSTALISKRQHQTVSKSKDRSNFWINVRSNSKHSQKRSFMNGVQSFENTPLLSSRDQITQDSFMGPVLSMKIDKHFKRKLKLVNLSNRTQHRGKQMD